MRENRLSMRLTARSIKVLGGLSLFCRAGLDFVYPPLCLMCGGEMHSASRQNVCSSCVRDLVPAIPDACRRCGAPVGPYLDTSIGCVHCRSTPFHFEKAICLGVYKDLLKAACLRMKHGGTEPLARALAELFWQRQQDQFEGINADRVVSVPQHWTRRFWKGHNSSETIARLLAKRLGIPADVGQVRKTRRTLDQKTLPRTRRLSNLRDAFQIRHPRTVQGRRILLVDDVLTTGTTANRISRLLKKAGAKSITVAALARSVGEAH